MVECDVDEGTWRLFEARCADTGETPAERLAKALQWALAPLPEPGEFPGLEGARACARAGEDGIALESPSAAALYQFLCSGKEALDRPSPDTTEFEAEFDGHLEKYGTGGIPRSNFAEAFRDLVTTRPCLAPEFALRLDLQDKLTAFLEQADGEAVSLAAFLDFATD